MSSGEVDIYHIPGTDGPKRGAPDGHVGAVTFPGGLSPVGLGPGGRGVGPGILRTVGVGVGPGCLTPVAIALGPEGMDNS